MTWTLMTATVRAETPAPERTALDQTMDAVLVVRSLDSGDLFLGSAFLWGEEALVAVTNAHVVGDHEEVRLTDRYGNEETGTVIATDPVRDVAVIAVGPGPDGKPRRGLVPSDQAATLGLEVFALGAPLGAEFTLTEGRVSAMARQVDVSVPLRLLQHDAAVNPGSSGGPLVDAEGRLMGMNSQIADGSRMFVGIAYAIAATDLSRIVGGLIDETLPAFPKLGLNARPVDRKLAEVLGVPAEGLLVDAVTKGGLAEGAGLRAGDIILAVDGVGLSEPGAFVFALEAALHAGGAGLTVARAGDRLDLAMSFAPPEEVAVPGLKLRDISSAGAEPERIRSYRLGALGVVLAEEGRVDALTTGSPAALAGLSRGDRILAVNGAGADDAGLAALEITGPVILLVQAPGGATRHLWLDPWGSQSGPRPVGGANVLDPAVVVF